MGFSNPSKAQRVFEFCPHFKSPPSVARRELSIDLTWLAHRTKPEFPPLLSGSRLGRVVGEGGVMFTPEFLRCTGPRESTVHSLDSQAGLDYLGAWGRENSLRNPSGTLTTSDQ